MKTLKQILRCRRGAVVVLMAAAVVGLTGMAAWHDAGMLYLTKYQLANAADAAALAGAQELPEDPTMRSPRRQASPPTAKPELLPITSSRFCRRTIRRSP